MKIRSESDDNLLLDKMLNIPNMIIAIASAFEKMVNIICKFIYMNVCLNYKNDALR